MYLSLDESGYIYRKPSALRAASSKASSYRTDASIIEPGRA
jgi:hypothetical protein